MGNEKNIGSYTVEISREVKAGTRIWITDNRTRSEWSTEWMTMGKARKLYAIMDSVKAVESVINSIEQDVNAAVYAEYGQI